MFRHRPSTLRRPIRHDLRALPRLAPVLLAGVAVTVKKSKPPARWHDRAARSVRAHPFISLGTTVSIVAVLAAVVPAVMWIDARYQTVSAAELYQAEYKQERTEIRYGQARLESLMLRNRAQDCTVRDRDQRRQRSDTEMRICQQYRDELKAAQERERVLYEQMQRGVR